MTLPPGPQLDGVRRACLIILDGWGIAPAGLANAITLAHTPVFDELSATYPHAERSRRRLARRSDGQLGGGTFDAGRGR